MHLTLSAIREFAGGSFVHGFLFVALALFPIVNPLGMAPIFLEYTGDLDDPTTARLARRVAINAFVLAVASLVVGPYVLKFFGLSLPAVQIAGAAVIGYAGWRLLNQGEGEFQRHAPTVSPDTILRGAFYPLTLPFTIGPGSIAVLVALGSDLPYGGTAEILETIGAVVAIAIVCLIVYVCYSRAERIFKRLGPTGVSVLLRLSAFILLCIGIQIAIEGFRSLATATRTGAYSSGSPVVSALSTDVSCQLAATIVGSKLRRPTIRSSFESARLLAATTALTCTRCASTSWLSSERSNKVVLRICASTLARTVSSYCPEQVTAISYT